MDVKFTALRMGHFAFVCNHGPVTDQLTNKMLPMSQTKSDSGDAIVPVDAAGVVLIKDSPDGIKVLVVKRSESARVMPSFWVFPGGKVESSDNDPRQAAARELMEEAQITFDPESLYPMSRFITPEGLPFRFDTRFYLGVTDDSAVAIPDNSEVTLAEWRSPQAMIDGRSDGTVLIAPPTVVQMYELTTWNSCDEAVQACAERDLELLHQSPW